MTSSEWEDSMEYERRLEFTRRQAELAAQDRKKLLKGIGWGLFIMGSALSLAWFLVLWIK